MSCTGTGGSPIRPSFFFFFTKLNEIESIELCRIILQNNEVQLIEKWIKEDKLTLTEELGDLCKKTDNRIAAAIYLRLSIDTNISSKIIGCFVELGSFDKIQIYCQRFNFTPNWDKIISNIIYSNSNNNTLFLENLIKGKYIIGPVIDKCPDSYIHFLYIETAVKLQDYDEVKRMCSESQYIQPTRIRDYLLKEDIPGCESAFIALCNRFKFIEDITKFFYNKQKFEELEFKHFYHKMMNNGHLQIN